MQTIDKYLRKFAKPLFFLGIGLFIFLILFAAEVIQRLFGFNFHLEARFVLILGICILLVVPKFYYKMLDKEAETPDAHEDYIFSRRPLMFIIFIGVLCIMMYFLHRLQ